MIPGITAQDLTASIPPTPPIGGPFAVQFNSAAVVLPSLTCVDNEFFAFAGWFKNNWFTSPGPPAWVVDPDDLFLSEFAGSGGANAGKVTAAVWDKSSHRASVRSSATVSSAWHHIMFAAQTDFGSGSKILKLKVDGVDATGSITDTSVSFSVQNNGLPLFVGTDDTGTFYTGSMCDLSIWPGFNFLTAGDISPATVALFYSAGWVSPSVAISALGRPPIMLTGNATDFPTNAHGTSGAFTVTSGSLTDDLSPP
jgi:hypothetical protein